METVNDLFDYIHQWDCELPPRDQFWQLGDYTALRRKGNQYYRANYERGPLLYALVCHRKPQSVVEFGTGRGYGTLSMARAMLDATLPGRIFSIDVLSPTSSLEWAIKRKDTNAPTVEQLSWSDVWDEVATFDWNQNVSLLNGRSIKVMRSFDHTVDFAFIDAGHSYDAVRHDFYSTLLHASDKLCILFDDYADKREYGVKKLIETEIRPHFDVTFFNTFFRDPYSDEIVAQREYQMVLVDFSATNQSLEALFPPTELRRRISMLRIKDILQSTIHRYYRRARRK